MNGLKQWNGVWGNESLQYNTLPLIQVSCRYRAGSSVHMSQGDGCWESLPSTHLNHYQSNHYQSTWSRPAILLAIYNIFSLHSTNFMCRCILWWGRENKVGVVGQTSGRGHSVLSQDLLHWWFLRTTDESAQIIQKSVDKATFDKSSYGETSLDWG